MVGDRWAVGGLVIWAVLVLAVLAILFFRQMSTLAYPVARILFEDQFRSLGDGHILPREGEVVTPAFAAFFMAPVYWLHAMAYFPLAELLGSAYAVTVERMNQFIVYLIGTPIVYRLVRHAKADRGVALVLAATYAIAPFAHARMLVCNSLAAAPFLLWSELGRVRGRSRVQLIGLIAATFSYPLTGFSAVLLALQDYWRSQGPQRGTQRRILIATASALAVVHFGVLGLWNRAHPEWHELHVGSRIIADMFGYPVFPYRLPPMLTEPVKLFEIALLMTASCVFLPLHPSAWFPAAIDLAYYAGTEGGIRDHTMVLSSIGLFTILGVRASLFRGGSPWRNRALVGGALFATLYGHALAGPNGLVELAMAPAPPRPHLEDIGACIPPGQKRCVVPPSLYAGFGPPCEQIATYEPADLENLRIEDAATTVFVAPSRFDCEAKNTTCGPMEDPKILAGLAAKIRSGQLHASVCPPWFVLLRSPDSAPSDPSAADRLESPHP